jgi:hypothetical protein
MTDVVRWARKKAVTHYLYDATMIDGEALAASLEKFRPHLIGVVGNPNTLAPITVECPVRPCRYASHAPRGVRRVSR